MVRLPTTSPSLHVGLLRRDAVGECHPRRSSTFAIPAARSLLTSLAHLGCGQMQTSEPGSNLQVGTITLTILGNKADMAKQQAVPEEEARGYAESIGAEHHYVSAKTGEGIGAALRQTVQRVLQHRSKHVQLQPQSYLPGQTCSNFQPSGTCRLMHLAAQAVASVHIAQVPAASSSSRSSVQSSIQMLGCMMQGAGREA